MRPTQLLTHQWELDMRRQQELSAPSMNSQGETWGPPLVAADLGPPDITEVWNAAELSCQKLFCPPNLSFT